MASIPLFYWSEIKFAGRSKENYGDLLSKYIVEKISGGQVKWVQPKKQPWYTFNKTNYLAIGSIIHHATRNSIIWGSGLIDEQLRIERANFKAVRGPRTREYLLQFGYECPEIYGDPALLLPTIYFPEPGKCYEIGIIPHYTDFQSVNDQYRSNPEILVIDLLTMDVEQVTNEILKCESLISSSLHGVIVAHAYKIPCVWVEFSDKLFGSGVKFFDYLESVKLPPYKPPALSKPLSIPEIKQIIESYTSLPNAEEVTSLQKGLISSSPF